MCVVHLLSLLGGKDVKQQRFRNHNTYLNKPSAAPGGSCGLTYVSALWHTFCKGPRQRKIDQRIDMMNYIRNQKQKRQENANEVIQ